MSTKKTRICSICRKNYHYCPSCAVDANKPTWMFIFCCENCRSFYNVLNDYRYKLLSRKEAYNELKKLDLSCADKLISDFRQIFDEILLEETQKEIVDKPVKIKTRKSTRIANEE